MLADGRLLSWSQESIRCWNLATMQGKILVPCVGTMGGVLNDGRLVSWAGGSLRFWEPKTGVCLAIREDHGQENIMWYRELSPDRLVTWSQNSIRLWDTQRYQPLAVLPIDLDPYSISILGKWTIQSTEDHQPVIQLHLQYLWDPIQGRLCITLPLDFNAPDLWEEQWTTWQTWEQLKPQDEAQQTALMWCSDPAPIVCWQGGSDVETHHLLEDGTQVVALASGHVFCLQLYRGNQRISLNEIKLVKEAN